MVRPYVVKYDFYYEGTNYLDQHVIVMAKDKGHAENIVKELFKAYTIRRYITEIFELTDNMFVIMDGVRGDAIRVFSPEFCEANGIDFKLPKKEND